MVTERVRETAKLSSDGRGGSDSAEVSNPRALSGVMPPLKNCATSSVSYQCNSTKRATPWAKEAAVARLLLPSLMEWLVSSVELHWPHRWLDLGNEVWFIKIDIVVVDFGFAQRCLECTLRLPWHIRTRKPRAHDDSTCCVRCGTAASWTPQACGDRTGTKLACEGNIHVGREVQVKKKLGVRCSW